MKNWIPAFAGMTLLTLAPIARGADNPTWANLEVKLDAAYRSVPIHKLPGRSMGILVPSDGREDLLTVSAFGHSMMDRSYRTIIFLMQAPPGYELDGLAVPGGEMIVSQAGIFSIDTFLRDQLASGPWPAKVDPELFTTLIPQALENQLSILKYAGGRSVTVLPIYINLSDPGSEVKDLAPALVDRIREAGADNDVGFVIMANLTSANSESALIKADALTLKAIRSLDIESLISLRSQLKESGDGSQPDFDALLMGILTLRWFGSDHAEVGTYAHSAQLVLTKDKSKPVGYCAAGFASGALVRARVPHVKQEKMAGIFDELFRADILTMTRQTLTSALDSTAAHPPALPNPQAAKKWPVYVSIFDAKGDLAGQSGSHVATGPLEESIRRYTVEAAASAKPKLSKENGKEHVIEVAIPYGFETTRGPDDYIPLLNGAIVTAGAKTYALPPTAWRTYPDPHQLLGEICFRLGVKPWTYALDSAKLESFRVFAFNEKEPFLELNPAKKKKKKGEEDPFGEDLGGGGAGGGGSFGF